MENIFDLDSPEMDEAFDIYYEKYCTWKPKFKKSNFSLKVVSVKDEVDNISLNIKINIRKDSDVD